MVSFSRSRRVSTSITLTTYFDHWNRNSFFTTRNMPHHRIPIIQGLYFARIFNVRELNASYVFRNTTERQPPRDWDPLVKQTYSVWVETGKGRRKWHLSKQTGDQGQKSICCSRFVLLSCIFHAGNYRPAGVHRRQPSCSRYGRA